MINPPFFYKYISLIKIFYNLILPISNKNKKNLEKMTKIESDKIIQLPLLYYPEIRGIAQPIRNLFYYLTINFE